MPIDKAKSAKHVSELATGISLLALIVSALSSYQSCSTAKDIAKSQTIKDSYDTFYTLNRLELENWQLSHLFVSPDRYEEVSKRVTASFGSPDETKRSELLLKERAMAEYIFTIYEQTFYQWNHANDVRDSPRAAFLEDVLNYFNERLLRNPRLVYYWSTEGGGIEILLENETRKYYQDHVLKNPAITFQQVADLKGPFSSRKKENQGRPAK